MMRPDLRIEPLRGNVNTRLAKLDDGDYDAIILAAAGLERLEFDDRISQAVRSATRCCPLRHRASLASSAWKSASELRTVLAQLNHATSVQTTLAERAIARVLEASCQSPVATYAVIDEDVLTVTALVAMPDGSESIRDSVSGKASRCRAAWRAARRAPARTGRCRTPRSCRGNAWLIARCKALAFSSRVRARRRSNSSMP